MHRLFVTSYVFIYISRSQAFLGLGRAEIASMHTLFFPLLFSGSASPKIRFMQTEVCYYLPCQIKISCISYGSLFCSLVCRFVLDLRQLQ